MNPPDAIVPEIYRRFTGFDKLTSFFGYWPDFHDAEVLFLLLDRSGQTRYEGPVAIIRIHAFAWSQEPDTGRTVIIQHCTVEFRFTELEAWHVVDFGFQNAIGGLNFENAGDSSGAVRVTFHPASGLHGGFTCGSVEVAAVTPGIPPGSTYEA